MANLDLAAGITVGEANRLLTGYYNTVPAEDSPFHGTETKTIKDIGPVVLKWNMTQVPVIGFGPPTQAVWDAALDTEGITNKAAGKPIPTADMVRVTIPVLEASVTIDGGNPIGGTTKNVVVYATVTFAGNDITITLVAVTINESDFKKWDKVIFNTVLLPRIFAAAQSMLGVIHIPQLSWEGVTLNTPAFTLTDTQLIAASTLSTNKNPLDTSGVTWPSNPVFFVASTALMNAALAVGVKDLVSKANANKTKYKLQGSGEWKGLADWDYDTTIGKASATVSKIAPLTIDALVSLVNVTAGGKLTAAGMALAAVGCALGAALLLPLV